VPLPSRRSVFAKALGPGGKNTLLSDNSGISRFEKVLSGSLRACPMQRDTRYRTHRISSDLRIFRRTQTVHKEHCQRSRLLFPVKVLEILDDGITELWSPRNPSQILADIYFVHGVTGHPFKTWHHRQASPSTNETRTRASQKFNTPSTHRRLSNANDEGDEGGLRFSSSRNRGCYWPLDLLPNDFDNVKVFTCGYNARPTRGLAGGNQMTLSPNTPKVFFNGSRAPAPLVEEAQLCS
jgi:hypothetical protein